MASDWAELRNRRNARESARSSAAPRPARADSATVSAPATAPLELPWQPHDLPDSLAVEQLPGRGRGIVARQPRRAGQTLLATTPLVSVLDARNLPHRCSHCFRSVDDIDTPPHARPRLAQCSRCHLIQYCSPSCQKTDWPIHKKECPALSAAHERSQKAGSKRTPDAPLRALGRLLWSAQQQPGSDTWTQVESLESHRLQLTPEEQERFFQLSVSLSAYVGQETLAASCPDAAAIIDLCSRFVSNSFALTSPTDLSNIGVSISPLTALINHSCAPNAVVVFPSFPASGSNTSKHMAVVALRDIPAGEEILTSYVDLSLPRTDRRRELEERYKFRCECEACDTPAGEVDPREAMSCPAAPKCAALLPISQPDANEVECGKCGAKAPYRDVQPVIVAAQQAYADAEKAQYSDPRLAMLHLANAISSMTTSLAPAPPLAPSCHPLYSSLQLLLTLQLHAHAFDRAETTASLALAGAERLFPSGSGSGSSSSGGHHPVLALLRTTHARLVTTPPASDPAHPEAEMQYWMATGARAYGVERLVGALRAVESAFGDGSCGEGSGPRGREGEKGGEMAKMLRVLIRDQEEGIEMGRRMRAAAAAQQ